MFPVIRKRSFSEDVFEMVIGVEPIARTAAPGHRVDLRVNPDAPAITTPVILTDADAGTITIVERARDLPTEQLMMLAEGDAVFQVRGPLGASAPVDELAKVVLAGEELGVASLLWRARRWRERGAYVIAIIAFAGHDAIFWEDEFAEASNELYVVTADGSYGVSGNLPGVLRAVCETHRDVDRIVAIASLRHLKRAAKIGADAGIDTRVAFDALRPPTGEAGVFEARADSPETFEGLHAAELAATDVDFDRLLARERALRRGDDRTAAA